MNPSIMFESRTGGDSALSAMLPGGVKPSPLPQSAKLPAITYEVIGDADNVRLGDTGGDRVATLAVHVIAHHLRDIAAIEGTVRSLWQDFAGELAGCRVIRAKAPDSRDIPPVREPGSETVIRQRTINLVIKYKGV